MRATLAPLTTRRAAAALVLVLGLWMTATLATLAQRPTQPGDPLPGLTAAEFEEFRLGLEDFLEVETAEEGLGPAFNGTSCGSCHNSPVLGGVSLVAEVRAGKRDATGAFQALDPSGETLIHLFSIPTHGCQPVVPADATVIERRVPIPLFGAGLVEAIDDDTLVTLANYQARGYDGVSGRAASIVERGTGERRIGRFGWKAQHATLLAFGADAYRNEMGITNDLFPTELALGVDAERMRKCDPIPDPEDIPDLRTRRRGIDNFASFMRFLAPPGRTATNDAVSSGDRIFNALGCATCHVPELRTGANANPLFDRQSVPLYSDLLLHDIGTGDFIRQGAAEPGEIRTPALWGLRLRRPLLHDGSAPTIQDAINRHGGEAALARQGFTRLSDADWQALLAFLLSL